MLSRTESGNLFWSWHKKAPKKNKFTNTKITILNFSPPYFDIKSENKDLPIKAELQNKDNLIIINYTLMENAVDYWVFYV